MTPHVANSELFPSVAPGLALAAPLPVLHATLWDDITGRRVARCGELATRGLSPVGDLCVLLDDVGQGGCGLVVKWWDLQPAETIPSIAQAAADVRAHDAKLSAAAAPKRRRSTRAQLTTPAPGA